MDKAKLLSGSSTDKASAQNDRIIEKNIPQERPPKGPSTRNLFPGGGHTFFGSFQRVRVEGRRGRGYWEWKAAESKKKNLYDDEEGEEQKINLESNIRSKGRVTFQDLEEQNDNIRTRSPYELNRGADEVRVLPTSATHQQLLNNEALYEEEKHNAAPLERITVTSFSQPRLTSLLARAKPPKEPESRTPSPPSGTIPSAPPKEFVYADSDLRRANRSQPVVGHEHQSLDCQESYQYPSETSSLVQYPAVVHGLTEAQVYNASQNIGLNQSNECHQYYLNRFRNEKCEKENQSKQSTYTDHSESSLNTTRNDNTLSSIASLSSNKNEFELDTKPLLLDENRPKGNKSFDKKFAPEAPTSVVTLRQQTSVNKNKAPSSDAVRRSGALVWVSQPGGGAKLEWIPTSGLSTLRAVPASPNYSNVKGKIYSESQQQKCGVASPSIPPKGIIKRGDEGGGGGGERGGTNDARVGETSLARVASNDPRVGTNRSEEFKALPGAQGSAFFSGGPSKNVHSSVPGETRLAGRTVISSPGKIQATCAEDGDKVVTVAGRGQGQTVRIRVRPEVHAYLSTLPIVSGGIRDLESPIVTTDRRDSIHSANSSSGSGLTLGSGEGSIGYQEQDYLEVVDEYILLKKAVDEHDPEAIRLLTATEAVYHPESGNSEYPYLREMKERLLIAKETPDMTDTSRSDQDNQLLEVHQTPVGTIVKLNTDGYGSHTSPTHRVESLYTGTLESRKTHAHEFFPKNAKTSTFITLSLLYATLCVVVCLGFVLSEVLTHNVPLYYYEAFFTYMYGLSIFFLLYVFCYLLSDSTREKKTPNNQVYMGSSHSGQYNVSEYEYFSCNEKVRKPEVLPADASPTQEKLTASIQKPKKHKTSDNDHSHGSFFLRIGAIAFGLGTMIYNGLEFGVFFEIPMNSPCHQILRGVNPLLQLVFTFMQMYFIFMNARLNIHKFKFLARFGLMHIVATNLCIWIRTLVRESLKEINEFRVTKGHSGEDYMILEGIRRALENRGLMQPNKYMYNLHAFSQLSELNDTMTEENQTITGNWVSEEDLVNRTCERMEIMGSIVSDSAPYLYPFIVEYSLIGAAVVYIMWKHIGRNPKFVYDAEAADGMSTLSRRCHVKVDCIGASKGLFCGLLVLVATLICLILFFVLIDQKELRMLAIYLADVSHCGIMVFSIFAIFIGFCRVRHLKFFGEREEELDDILLMVSAFGLFAYATFSAIAGSMSAFTEEPNLLVMVTSILSIIQVMIQMVFIKDTQRRQVALPEQERTKPGRQIVTFLLICNLAMWVIYTFETPKVEANPVQLEFFGKLSWTILLRCTLPLAIFHRFHSSVVLAAIWKNSYKTRLE